MAVPFADGSFPRALGAVKVILFLGAILSCYGMAEGRVLSSGHMKQVLRVLVQTFAWGI